MHEVVGYSHLAKSKPGAVLVETAGQVGITSDGKYLETYEEQVHQSFRNLKDALAAGGATPADIVKIRYYIKDWDESKLPPLRDALIGFVNPLNPPPSVLLSAPALSDPRLLFEVEATAMIEPPTCAESRHNKFSTVDVVVVGAGASGVQAAVDVQKDGLSCIVLEAMDRIGGRTFSVPASHLDNGIVELGGAWINDTSQEKVWALAQKYNIATVEQRVEGWDLTILEDGTVTKQPYGEFAFGKEIFDNEIFPVFQELDELSKGIDIQNPAASPRARELDSITVAEWARNSHPSPSVYPMIRMLLESKIGIEPEEISLLFYVSYIAANYGFWNMISDRKNGGQYLRVRGGTQQFAVCLSKELLDGSIELSMPVKKIVQQGPSQVRVEAGLDRVIFCKKVIVTIPTQVYSKIQFSPALPPAKKDLAESTFLGYYSKLALVYRKPWWLEGRTLFSGTLTSFGNGPIVFTRDTSFPEDDLWVITCFCVGEAGRKWSWLPEGARRKAVIDQFNGALSTVFKNIPDPIAIHELEWTKKEYCPGAPIPIMGPGVLSTNAGKSIAQPFDNIHFAGTETAARSKGFIDGALLAGSRAAEVSPEYWLSKG
ncbi:FAD/NAD(P)-binding domain-containing protein [Zopfia rhizophila CBS 207.26]|uniref:Amine oxidase n=1 Tax=Zopfia rhizophila CBS 207.26 TaxID=1314779 RepID=A0A6A6DCR8_9PEZI|nr:FAD/NAD(P)-binding domain-containing protein [Zopfia rhizophila CBS 207.26]